MRLMKRSARGRLILLCSCFFAATVLSCKADQLTSHGSDIVLLYDEPEGCENLGVVVGHGGGLSGAYSKPSVNRQSAENDARNQAAARGATHLLLYPDEVAQGEGRGPNPESTDPPLAHGYGTGSNVTVAGTAYRCPPGAVVTRPMASAEVGTTLVEVEQPTAIPLDALGRLEYVAVYRKVTAESGGMTEAEALRIDDTARIEEAVSSLEHVVEDPLKFIPTHRIEIVGELGTQSLLYGFGYFQYAGKVYRLTDGAFESALDLREKPGD